MNTSDDNSSANQCTDNQCTDNQCTDNHQCTDNQCTANQCTDNQCTDNDLKKTEDWPIIEPLEDPQDCNDAVYCYIFRTMVHPKIRQNIKQPHPMINKIIECKCKLHYVVKT